MAELLVEMEHIHKYFAGVHALNDVRFKLRAGKVMALVGENGAGKSTLMNVLTGICRCDSGEIRISGKHEDIRSVADAQSLGISMIHQDLNLMKDLTVAENIYIGREPLKLSKRKEKKTMAEVKAMAETNPVFQTAIGTACLFAKSGDAVTAAYIKAMDLHRGVNDGAPFTDGKERLEYNGESFLLLNYAIPDEYRHRMLDHLILESGCRNVLDLACGYTSRAVLMGENGINYVGGDLHNLGGPAWIPAGR